MPVRLNPAWAADMHEQLAAVAGGSPKTVEYVSATRKVIQYLVALADELRVPYKVIQLGAGVCKFTTDTTVCPKCGGSGKC